MFTGKKLSMRKNRTGLQGRMTLSYVWVTASLVFVLEILTLIGLSLILFLIVTPFMYTLEAKQVAQHYVLIASLKAKTDALDPCDCQGTFARRPGGVLKCRSP